MDGLLAHDRAEEGRAGDALRLLQAFVERGDERPGPAPDLGRDREQGVERLRRTLHEPVVGVVGRVEDGYEDVASREETAEWGKCEAV